ncbi:DUF3265 domain-containing protein, partial [Vibrio parahaemolyticus]|nr:DUF3265 domain-containing protein [Vibrio parahaemolyticus]
MVLITHINIVRVSPEHAHNKLFKRDSQRVAFSLC